MQTKIQKRWLNPLEKLKEPTRNCKICFKELKNNNLLYLFNKHSCLCSDCLDKLKAKFIKFDVDGVKALSVYNYDENIKSLIYQFKGCRDIELSDIFLFRYSKELKIMFQGYTLVPVPSYYKDDEEREFNQVVEAFKCLNLPLEKLLYKTGRFKQKEHNSLVRNQIEDYIELLKIVDLSKKKILLVDDIFTTGSTMRVCVKLIRSLKPKDLKVLVLCKTFDLN